MQAHLRGYTFQPRAGVFVGGLVPVGAWTGARTVRDEFHEEARRKRRRDAAMQEDMQRRAPSGVLRCDVQTEAARECIQLEPEPSEDPPRPSPLVVTRPSDGRLPYQRLFDPSRIEQYVGNEQSRKQALEWLRRFKLDAAQRPRRVEAAMLLLWGPVGTGKSAWAQYAAVSAGFEVVRFTPGDVGKHKTQDLKFFLETQPAMGLRNKKLFAVILDDVEELFRDCKGAFEVRVPCPIIATAGPSVSASIRTRADLALSFGRIRKNDAWKVIRRIRPHADASFTKHVEEQAGGDLRQLIIKASGNGAWCGRGSTDLYQTCVGRARMVLNSDAPLRLDDWEEEERRGGLSDLLIHHNFIRCCSDSSSLDRYADFLQLASTLDAIRAVDLVAFAARRWRACKSGDHLDALPASAPLPARGPDRDEETRAIVSADVEEARPVNLKGFVNRRSAAGAALPLQEAGELYLPLDAEGDAIRNENQKHWVYRLPSFKPGLHLACELFRGRCGGPLLAAQRRHEVGERIELACLSPSLRLGTDHVDDLLDRFRSIA